MRDPWRGGRDVPGPSPDDEDALGQLPMWHLNCPGGRVVVRSPDARDEFGGLGAVARLLRHAGTSPLTASGLGVPHVLAVLPGEPSPSPRVRSLRLSASRGEQVVTVYAVNVQGALPGEQERNGLRLVHDAVRDAVRRHPGAARDLGVSVVIR